MNSKFDPKKMLNVARIHPNLKQESTLHYSCTSIVWSYVIQQNTMQDLEKE